MNFSKEMMQRASQAKSVEELVSLAKENGMELDEQDASHIYAELHTEGELDDEELENVSGGDLDCNSSRSGEIPLYHVGDRVMYKEYYFANDRKQYSLWPGRITEVSNAREGRYDKEWVYTVEGENDHSMTKVYEHQIQRLL